MLKCSVRIKSGIIYLCKIINAKVLNNVLFISIQWYIKTLKTQRMRHLFIHILGDLASLGSVHIQYIKS